MSVFDILTATWQFASTWPIPKGTDGVAFSAGTQYTCAVQGFFIQLGMGTPVCKFSVFFSNMFLSRYAIWRWDTKL